MIARAAILTLILAAELGIAAHAEPNKVQYELQASCRKDAAEFFQRFEKRDPSAVSFTNHYSQDLNGCFVSVYKTRFGKRVTWIEWRLWDVNENRQIDVLAFQPNREELRTSAKGWPPALPNPYWMGA